MAKLLMVSVGRFRRSLTIGNVFDIQTGVAIIFLVKLQRDEIKQK